MGLRSTLDAGEVVLAEGHTVFWHWRVTTLHVRLDRLGWPLLLRSRRVPLQQVSRVQVATGNHRLARELHVSAVEGRVFRWHRGAVVAYPAAGPRIVIATRTGAAARELGRLLGDAAARERARVEGLRASLSDPHQVPYIRAR